METIAMLLFATFLLLLSKLMDYLPIIIGIMIAYVAIKEFKKIF